MKTISINNFTRVKNCINGNSRYVIHFLDLLTEGQKNNTVANLSIEGKYQLALIKAKKIGGKKYLGKDFGGGIVFQSCNIQDTVNRINELLG